LFAKQQDFVSAAICVEMKCEKRMIGYTAFTSSLESRYGVMCFLCGKQHYFVSAAICVLLLSGPAKVISPGGCYLSC
jgi:hypothetical protein